MGNTGNARTTGPHLHFGIYQSGRARGDRPAAVHSGRAWASRGKKLTRLPKNSGDTARVVTNTRLRLTPENKAETVESLTRNQIVRGTWRLRRLAARQDAPTTAEGYLPASAVRDIGASIGKAKLVANTPIYDEAYPNAAVYELLPKATTLQVLGTSEDFELVEINKAKGWVRKQ